MVTIKDDKVPIMQVIWFFISSYKLQIIILFILSLLTGVLEAGSIAAIYPILNAAFSPESVDNNFILVMFQTIAGWLPVSDLFISFCIVFLLFTILSFAIKYTAITYRTRFIAHLVLEKQNDIYSRIIRADYQFFIERKQGDLLYTTSSAPYQLSTLITSVSEILSQTLLCCSVLVLLFSLSWAGATGVLVMGIAYVFLSRYLGQRISYNSSQKEVEAAKESNVLFNESVNGIKQIKVFALGYLWIARFRRVIEKRWNNNIRRTIWQQLLPNILLLVLYLGVAVTVLFIKLINPVGFMELVPVFGAFAFAVFRLIPFVNTIGNTMMAIQTALPDCEIMYAMLNEQTNHVIDGEKKFESLRNGITFNNVSFAYKERTDTVRNLTLIFEKGKTTAIVGRSGSGKTTIVSLLLRLFDVDKGELRIDGIDIREYHLDSWLNKIGYVSQDSFILNDTVEQNITFGVDGYTREKVIQAAQYADAHTFVSELPEGYDTIVGDKGMRLSGGQAQRIAVARAMLREPEILIFDEATNNLDNISELAVQRAIEEISKNHTVILIAHRLSTIENADKVIVLEKGQVIEQGTHSELLEKKGAYWRLHQRKNE